MTILIEFIEALEKGLADYQNSRKLLRENRAKDCDEFYAMFKQETSAVALRRTCLQKITQMKVGDFSLIGWLDLNALRKRLLQVITSERFSLLNLLIGENSELHQSELLLQTEIRALQQCVTYTTALSPQSLENLEQKMQNMEQRLEVKDQNIERLKQENHELCNRVTKLSYHAEHYQKETQNLQRQLEVLHDKYVEKLQEISVLQGKLGSGVALALPQQVGCR